MVREAFSGGGAVTYLRRSRGGTLDLQLRLVGHCGYFWRCASDGDSGLGASEEENSSLENVNKVEV